MLKPELSAILEEGLFGFPRLRYNLTYIAVAISAALSLQVISSTIIGAGLPLLVKRLGGDPAVAASPAITTFVDITGLLIYFGIATMLVL